MLISTGIGYLVVNDKLPNSDGSFCDLQTRSQVWSFNFVFYFQYSVPKKKTGKYLKD